MKTSKKLGHGMLHGKAIWKPGIAEIVKALVLTVPASTQSYKGQCADTCWIMTYDHKTQSFMKNGGQQNCLDKALLCMLEPAHYLIPSNSHPVLASEGLS